MGGRRALPPFPREMNALLQFRDWSSLHADLAFIYEGAVPRDYVQSRFTPQFLGAWLIRRGTAEVEQDGRKITAGPGDWIILRRAEGTQKFSEDAKILSIRFEAEWPDRKPFFDTGLTLAFKSETHPQLERSARQLLHAVQPLQPPAPTDLRVHAVGLRGFIEVKAKFWEWFGELHDALASQGVHPTRTGILDERVLKVLHYLDRIDLSERIREEALARQAGLSTAHFVRLFRDEVGTTPKRYFDERRKDACRRLLTVSDTPIKEIAIGLGFLRLSDFSAWFKDGHDLSPRHFREREQKRGAGLKAV